ncbi:MAG: Octaprenyl diphosphate synthase [Holosporales bacterium]
MKPLEKLLQIHQSELESVHQKLLKALENPVEIIPALGKHILHAGGKKLRPLLTLACAKVFQENISDGAIALAAAVECIHTATLIHDDVLDESELRRGVPTANSLWGNSCSILVGDFLFAKAFELMTSCQNMEILKLLSTTSTKICQGEVKQLVMTNDIDAVLDDYFDVIDLKTGALFESACASGAMASGAGSTDVDAFRHFGLNLGRAFQIVDDILDYAKPQQELGKNPGDDYREGKITLPILLLILKDPTFKNVFQDDAKIYFDPLKDAMLEHNIFYECYTYVDLYSKRACMALHNYEKTPLVQCLLDLTIDLQQRNF